MAPRKRYAEPVKHEELFTAAEKAEIKRQAEEQLASERKKAAAKELLAKYKEEAIAASEPEQALYDVMIDVPGYTKNIMVDGRCLMQGTIVRVTKLEADSLREIMANAWRHERANGGAFMKEYMPPREDVVSGGGLTGGQGSKLIGRV
jgi:hypothetical protein